MKILRNSDSGVYKWSCAGSQPRSSVSILSLAAAMIQKQSCLNRDHRAHKAKNTYCLAIYRKSVPTPELR